MASRFAEPSRVGYNGLFLRFPVLEHHRLDQPMAPKGPDPRELATRLKAAEAKIRRLQAGLWIVGVLCAIALFQKFFWLALAIIVVLMLILIPAGWWVLRYTKERDEQWLRDVNE